MVLRKGLYTLLLFLSIFVVIPATALTATIHVSGLQISIDKVLVASEMDAQMNPAKPSGKFVYVSFSVKNRTKEKRTLTKDMFAIVHDNGTSYTPSDSASASITSPVSKPLTSTQISPGNTAAFTIAYDLPAAIDLKRARLKIQPSKTAAAWYGTIDVSHIN